jgi:hypothetical protein
MTAPDESRRHAPGQNLTPRNLSGFAVLLIEIASLQGQLSAARLRAANLEAAMRAALSAEQDGEPDPLSYLRDEITYPGGTHGA